MKKSHITSYSDLFYLLWRYCSLLYSMLLLIHHASPVFLFNNKLNTSCSLCALAVLCHLDLVLLFLLQQSWHITKLHSHSNCSAYLHIFTFQFPFFMMIWFINLLQTCVLESRNIKNNIANFDQNVSFMLSTMLYTYCCFTSGIAIGCCMFFWDWIRQYLCINYVSYIHVW